MFARKVLNFDQHNQNRIRRFLRMYYGAFDRMFVLNADQRKWLTGREMNFADDKVFLTAHWADDIFKPMKTSKKEALGIDHNRPVMLYVGRVSKEKGVLELPRIYKAVWQAHPNIALAVVGQGPAYDQLKKELPEGYYFDWVPRERLPAIYSAADILVFPSRFDTFSCTVLESISCGLPVVACNTKGPKDIVVDGVCGFLVNTEAQMAEKITAYLADPQMQKRFREAAVQRAGNYDACRIMDRLMADVGLKV
jgi:glycosyltransferase involved in cell wall biosynthesis